MTQLGKAVRHAWRLDPDFCTVNHGSFGATPDCVLAEQDTWRRRMEAQPTRFMSTLPAALRATAARLAAFLGANSEDIAFVDNATGGCNAVLRSLSLRPDDEVLVLDHGYGAVRNTVRFVTGLMGARMTEAAIPFPNATPEDLAAAVAAGLTSRTRVAVIDHITSASALVLPVDRIAAICHDAGVPILIDGAHGPGQLDLDLNAIGADWYTGNCHKWLCAPKGSAFLWTSPARQAETHPTVISHGFGQGYLKEFDWTGTRDPSAVLSIPAAIDFHEQLGGATLRQRNIDLAAEAASLVARRLNTEAILGDPGRAMRLVRLPVAPGTQALPFRARLLQAGTDAPVHAIGGALWLRLSAFAYNEIEDYTRLADIVAGVLRESS
ncbi:MAG: aminotransferase class V-fold PLP-dependent enzyme [Acetobacteraceae bacterium]|nr:aminotransferase class V-fold PLP-dependent enzyme [Acetobacteraceae bacterium]